MPRLAPIPENPYQATAWPSSPYATSPAAAHSLLHTPDSLARYPAVAYLTSGLATSPRAMMEQYWPAGARDVQALQGLGASEGEGVLAAVGLGLLAVTVLTFAVRGFAGYYVGKAAAPDASSETTYGIGGAVAGVALGVYGLAGIAGLGHAMSKD